jgi:DNA-binding IclR family transcriptional regulator
VAVVAADLLSFSSGPWSFARLGAGKRGKGTLKLLQLGNNAHDQTDYVKVARPFKEALSAETGHCVFVGKRDGDYSLHLERVDERLTVSTVPGDRRFITDTGIARRCCSTMRMPN